VTGELAGGGTEEADAGSQARRFEHYEVMLDHDGRPIELGRGAMGITYKALDVNLRCPVTLKVISERYLGDESARLRFLREARAAAGVRHPNVASVFHLGRTGSSYFYAMEFVEGKTLEHLIRRSGSAGGEVGSGNCDAGGLRSGCRTRTESCSPRYQADPKALDG
jgi:serine/threonine protein kinase